MSCPIRQRTSSPIPAQRTRRRALAFLLAVMTALVPAATAEAARSIPVGLASTNDQNLRTHESLLAIRFVLDRDTSMYRFMSGFKTQGASWDPHSGSKCGGPGSGCYGAGDGGIVNARLVTVKADGTPNLSNVLAEETRSAKDRYFDSKNSYGVDGITQMIFSSMGGIQLKRNTMYAMVYRNTHRDPVSNFFSINSPTVKESAAGPNGRNNLDPDAAGAIAGLDPREAVASSTNGGGSWSWGRQVGPYFGSPSSDDGTRLPWYGWQTSASTKPQANQPYYQYWNQCSACTLTARNVPRKTTLTEAGGYAPVGSSVGVVTVRNTRTGQIGRTGSLGSGIVKGALSSPVAVEPGDTYEITNTGTVYRYEADAFLVKVFGLGAGAFPFTTAGSADAAQLFALPHPYFAVPEPVVARSPRRVILKRATLILRRAAASRRNASRVGRMVLKGQVTGPRARPGLRVAIQMRRHAGGWRTIGRTELRSRGRFVLDLRVNVRRPGDRLRVRAAAPGAGRSVSVRVALKR